MKLRRNILLGIGWLLSVNVMLAQVDAQLTQYFSLPAYFNPGAAGDTEFVRIAAAARLQWVGVQNAPRTFLLSGDAPLMVKDQSIGVGVNVQYETLGLFANTIAGVQGAWHLEFGKQQIGIGAILNYVGQRFRGGEAILPENDGTENEPQPIPAQDISGNAFDFGVGVWYSTSKFYVGLSALHLLQPRIRLELPGQGAETTSVYESEVPRQGYFIAGGNIPIKHTLFSIHPSLLARTNFKNFSAEGTFRVSYARLIYIGAGYRWKESFSVMIGADIKNFYLGYAYDIPMSAIGKASSGSHELVAGYRIKLSFDKKNKFKQRSVRFM